MPRRVPFQRTRLFLLSVLLCALKFSVDYHLHSILVSKTFPEDGHDDVEINHLHLTDVLPSSSEVSSPSLNERKNKRTIPKRREASSYKNHGKSKYAYAFVIGGVDPAVANYKGFLYNVLVSAKILKEEGSWSDVLVFIQLSSKSPAEELPNEEVHFLKALGVKIVYIPKSELESFYETTMHKFRILSLIQYHRVLVLDADVMPIANLDYLFELSDGPGTVLKENVVVKGPREPANGGLFLLQPGRGEFEHLTDIIHTREENAHVNTDHGFDIVNGWGHAIEPPDEWVSRNGRGTNWTFNGAYVDQGLLYHWVKYVKKSVSIISYGNEIENWGAGVDGKVQLEKVLPGDAFANYSKPRIRDWLSCKKFMCDSIHFTGRSKPWLNDPPEDFSNVTDLKDATLLWWRMLKQLNDELGMALDFKNWTAAQWPHFGMFAKYGEMGKRISSRTTASHEKEIRQLINAVTDVNVTQNAEQVKAWRKRIRDQCAAAKDKSDVLAIDSAIQDGFSIPDNPSPRQRDDKAIKPCKRVVMDFGANIGDTSAKVIDAGLVGCNRQKDLKARIPDPTFNVETKRIELPKGGRNPLTQHFIHLMSGFEEPIGAEDYCYYGIEGNPVFTERLQKLEDYIMDIRPRPIEYLHFFTESVGAGQDGGTKLYLDTTNAEKNFWGSSLFKNHQDVQKQNGTGAGSEVVAVDVMGYTLGTLMRKTMIAFDPNASEEDKKGGHFLLKMDIEGGEYPLLAQAAEEGTLCEYVGMGNQADLYIEYHSQRVTGKNKFVKNKKAVQEKLEKCGVNFRPLKAWWA